MTTSKFPLWRLLFLGGGLGIVIGSPQHPSGTLEQMLGDPAWLPSHLWVLAGFVLLLAGVAAYRGQGPFPPRTARWVRLALAGTALQTLEMAVHTAAVVDHGHLVAGEPAPVLMTHLVMAVTLYPLFAITLIGLIVAGARERTLGSWWIAPLGLVGVAAHGVAPLLAVAGAPESLRILFAGIALVGLWAMLAALWPLRAPAAAAAPPVRAHDRASAPVQAGV